MKSSDDIVWQPVAGYEGLYKVSNTGLVASADRHMRSVGGRMVTKEGAVKTAYYSKSCNGMAVALSKHGESKLVPVAESVAKAFVPNPRKLDIVRHINEDIRDNGCQNLEWSGSARYSSLVKTWSDADILFIKKSNLHCRDLMDRFKVSKSTIYAIKKGTHKRCASVKQKD